MYDHNNSQLDRQSLLSFRMTELGEEATVTRHYQGAGERKKGRERVRGGVGGVYHNQLLCLGAKEKKNPKLKIH